MSARCPSGQTPDTERTAFGQCLDLLRTPRVGARMSAGAPDPTRPDPTRSPDRTRVRAVQQFDSKTANSPSPNRSLPSALTHEPTVLRTVWQTLLGGLHSLSENDYGRPWPYPDRQRLATLTAEFDADLCLKAAREAREIVQSQDRAPNITALFEKKLRDLGAEAEHRSDVREAIRQSLQEAV